ncbi:MAG: hemerythrin domain-containing protein [Acidobacteriia bacterium]|nr:hemerythrin domain-containing protein [Terriglobia bacterium]
MATATKVLRHEHEAILKMLEVTEKVANRLEQGEAVRQEVLANLQEFFRLFADQCHHGKEEDLLFPLLEQKGIPRTGGPIGVLLREHEEGRSLIRQMGDAAEATKSGLTGAGSRWAGAARGYVGLLHGHIEKENNVLFMMAERLLTPGEQEQLAEDFEKLEVDKMGVGTHERLHAMMDKMLVEFLPK